MHAATAYSDRRTFSETYDRVRRSKNEVHEAADDGFSEMALQGIWHERLFSEEGLRTDGGQTLRILSPGWWNRGEGPDFRDAQIEFNGDLLTGDVEIHFTHAAWTQHGHDRDARYNDVVLVVAFESTAPRKPLVTSEGRCLATLSLVPFLEKDLSALAQDVIGEDDPDGTLPILGHCSSLAPEGLSRLRDVIELAGEWRILNKAHVLRERMGRVGEDQAIYESLLSACGFSHFKHHFRTIARQLHYDRSRQLGRQDPHLLETALLQIGGLLPETLPEGVEGIHHLARLQGLRRERLAGLRSLPFTWRRVGVRPINSPERRLAGAARLLARTADRGLSGVLTDIWQEEMTSVERRRLFERIFPSATGFWATHCTWSGKTMDRPLALLGSGRVRSIIGNVFVPAALAIARQQRDRQLEERVFEFFVSLPKEPSSRVTKVMEARILRGQSDTRLDFRAQQGLLQIYQDWCVSNPSCHNCPMARRMFRAS